MSLQPGIYDAKGTLVLHASGGAEREAGPHSIAWDGLDRNGQPAAPGKYKSGASSRVRV